MQVLTEYKRGIFLTPQVSVQFPSAGNVNGVWQPDWFITLLRAMMYGVCSTR